jgi:hypothetical protein
MGWFEESRQGLNEATGVVHGLGRQAFASNYAQGGISSWMFPQEGVDTRSLFKARYGSARHVRNLEAMAQNAKTPEAAARYQKTLTKAKAAGPTPRGGGLMGLTMMGAFVALPAFTTEGGWQEKSRAVAEGMGAFAGWEVGAKAGMMTGATVGSAIPVIGSAVGAVAGYIAGGFLGSEAGAGAVGSGIDVIGRIHARGRRARTSNWIEDTTAFNTRKAYTMRQASLQMMNTGMNSARNAMGHEGVMFHQ